MRPTNKLIDLQPDGPYRPPNFRWQLALHPDPECDIPPEWLDPWVLDARAFIGALRKCTTEADRINLERQEPDKYGAWTLFHRQPPHPRWEAEARILAEEPFESIAGKLAIPKEVLEWYERWFFFARDRLDAKGYILHQVIRWDGRNNAPDEGTIWKLFGFRGGPLVLDALIHGSPGAERPTQFNDLAAYLADDFRATMGLKALVSLNVVAVTGESAVKLLKIHLQHHRMERRTKGQDKVPKGVTDTFAENLQVFFEDLPWGKEEGLQPKQGICKDG